MAIPSKQPAVTGEIQYLSCTEGGITIAESTFTELQAAIAKEANILHPSADALIESFEAGLALIALDPARGNKPIGYIRLEPLVDQRLREKLNLPTDFPDIMELGTMFIDPSSEYRGQGYMKRMCEILFRLKEEELTSGKLLVIGTTKDYRVLRSLQSLENSKFEASHHGDYPHVAAFTCICQGDFGQGYQYGIDGCLARVDAMFRNSVEALAKEIRESDNTRIPCVMFVDNPEKAKQIDDRLRDHFSGPMSVELLKNALTDAGYYPDTRQFIPLEALKASIPLVQQ